MFVQMPEMQAYLSLATKVSAYTILCYQIMLRQQTAKDFSVYNTIYYYINY